MPAILPSDPAIDLNGRVLADLTAEGWDRVIAALHERLGWPGGKWRRMAGGKNPVFGDGGAAILKLIPPYWSEDAVREMAALRAIPAGGPVATPTLLKHAIVDGWTVLLLERLPGTILAEQWNGLDRDQRADMARQNGAIAGWLHRLAAPADAPLALDWPALLDEQDAAVPADLVYRNVPATLQATWPAYRAAVGPLPTPGAPAVLLHGDLSAGNLLVEEQGGRARITGLIDFGDASLGESTHDWISPVTHNYGGDPAVLAAFCDGYGLREAERTPELQAHFLVRSLLYYSWGYLAYKFPRVREANSWDEVAAIIWPIR